MTLIDYVLFRAHSESRGISLQYVQSSVVQLPNIKKIKHLTDDVKRRTFSSIQMWKDKMRKSCSKYILREYKKNMYALILITRRKIFFYL